MWKKKSYEIQESEGKMTTNPCLGVMKSEMFRIVTIWESVPQNDNYWENAA